MCCIPDGVAASSAIGEGTMSTLKLEGQQLNITDQAEYLGVVLYIKLSWN